MSGWEIPGGKVLKMEFKDYSNETTNGHVRFEFWIKPQYVPRMLALLRMLKREKKEVKP